MAFFPWDPLTGSFHALHSQDNLCRLSDPKKGHRPLPQFFTRQRPVSAQGCPGQLQFLCGPEFQALIRASQTPAFLMSLTDQASDVFPRHDLPHPVL